MIQLAKWKQCVLVHVRHRRRGEKKRREKPEVTERRTMRLTVSGRGEGGGKTARVKLSQITPALSCFYLQDLLL